VLVYDTYDDVSYQIKPFAHIIITTLVVKAKNEDDIIGETDPQTHDMSGYVKHHVTLHDWYKVYEFGMDDFDTRERKMKYALDLGLAGVFLWCLEFDVNYYFWLRDSMKNIISEEAIRGDTDL